MEVADGLPQTSIKTCASLCSGDQSSFHANAGRRRAFGTTADKYVRPLVVTTDVDCCIDASLLKEGGQYPTTMQRRSGIRGYAPFHNGGQGTASSLQASQLRLI